MSIPAVGNVMTPSGFQTFSAQGEVLLTWNQTPLATIFYISRSSDNISFSELGTTTDLSYSDSTGTVGTLYYYYVQAGNGTNSSLPAPSLTALSLKPGQETAGNIILECQQRCNKENSQFYTQQELLSMVSKSYKELYDLLIAAYGDDYYVATPYTYSTGTNQQQYPLPDDFYKSLLVEVALNPQDPNSFVTIRQFMLRQKNLWNYPNQYTMYGITNIRYRIEGNNLMIVPQTQGGQTLRIWYAPRPNQILTLNDVVDGISGWEEYIVSDVCRKMMIKEESFESAMSFASDKSELNKRLIEMSNNRNIGESQTVTDAKLLNFSWGESGDGGFGGMGW